MIAPRDHTAWHKAQESERAYWLRPEVQAKIRARHQAGYYRSQAGWLAGAFEKELPPTSGRPIMQIGSAAIGAINWWPHALRLAVDPMAPFFRLHFRDVLTPSVQLLRGIAEKLPFADGVVEGMLATQIFGHLQDPRAALAEAHRVVCVGGWLICSVSDTMASVDEPALRQIWQKKEIRTFGSVALLAELNRAGFDVVRRIDHLQGEEKRVFVMAERRRGVSR